MWRLRVWFSHVSTRGEQSIMAGGASCCSPALCCLPLPGSGVGEMREGGVEESPHKEKKRFVKLKNPAKIWKNLKPQNANNNSENEAEVGENLLQEQKAETLEEISRSLIMREEQLFSQASISEGDEDQLHKDLEDLTLQIWTAIHDTFASSSTSFSGETEVLRSAVLAIQQQEEQDRRWTGCPEDRVPVWRPQKCLSTHNRLLQNMVESRLVKAAEEDQGGADGLSSPLKREVCLVGRRVKEDLLTVARTVVNCYPPQTDILNLYAGLYHRDFSTRMNKLAASELKPDDCCYLLFWTNHCYPNEILKHDDLEGKIKTACLGSLLQPQTLDRLEDQYLTHKQDKVKLWLNTALRKEEESWLSGKTPELIDQYCFSPLAIDIIQVIDGSLSELSCTVREQTKAQKLMAHLESFLISHKKCVEEFLKGNHRNVRPVIKAQLVCEQQFRNFRLLTSADIMRHTYHLVTLLRKAEVSAETCQGRNYITGLTDSLSDQQRQSCLDTLSTLKDCGYKCLACPKLLQLKVHLSQLWTAAWMDGSLPVVDSLLNFLNQQLSDLCDLEPTCRQSVLSVLHEDVAHRYVKMTMKTRGRSREQQVAGAQRMVDDAKKINDFFSEGGCSESLWLGEMLVSLAELVRLQDPGSVQLEMVSLARRFPDLSDVHVLALLSLKTGLSAADVRSIRRSVEDNRHHAVSTNQSPPFFSKIKVKWISTKMNQLKS